MVNDGLNASAAATCSFAVTGNAVPTAVINASVGGTAQGAGAVVVPSSPSIPTVALTAASTDVENNALTHVWRVLSGGGSLSATSGTSVIFTPPAAGNYTIGLVSSDEFNPSTETTRVITVDAPPVVSFTVNGQPTTSPPTIRAGEGITLASTTTDDRSSPTVSWSVTPPGGGAAITGSSANLAFTSSNTAGTYAATLTANDGVNPPVSTTVSVVVSAQPGAVACGNTAPNAALYPAATSPFSQQAATRFAPPTTDAATTAVSVGTSGVVAGNSACFHRTVYEAIMGSDPIAQGSYQYFEVIREDSGFDDATIAVGVAASDAPMSRSADGTWPTTRRAVYVQGGSTVFGSSRTFDMEGARNPTVNDPPAPTRFGIAVDYRERYPVVSVIGPPSKSRGNALPRECRNADDVAPGGVVNPALIKDICVLTRTALNMDTPDPVRVFAFGRTDGSRRGKVTINGGESAPYTITDIQRRDALRSAFPDAERDLNPQLVPASVAALPTVTIERTSPYKTLLLSTSVTPTTGLRTQLTVSTPSGGTVEWFGPTGASLNVTGTTLDLPATRIALIGSAAPPAGGTTVRVDAVVTEAGVSGRAAMSRSVPFLVTYVPPGEDTLDHDGDGLNFDQEVAAGTDPASADTDSDGQLDGSDSSPLVPVGGTPGVQTVLARELITANSTSRTVNSTAQGVRVADDGLTVTFTDELNPACVDSPPFGILEICNKRGMRANAGVPPGEFRYFEVTNLVWGSTFGNGRLANMGAGVVPAAGATLTAPAGTLLPPLTGGFANSVLDPYCCFNVNGVPDPAGDYEAATSRSSTFNWAGNGGFLRRLLVQQSAILNASQTVGVAIRHQPAGTVTINYVYSNGTAVIASQDIEITSFPGNPVPFVFGHPQSLLAGSNVNPALQVNFGQAPFVYDSAPNQLNAVRKVDPVTGTLLTSAPVSLRPGIGINERPLRP